MRNWLGTAALERKLCADAGGGGRSARHCALYPQAWGDAQARRYAAQLERGLEAVVSGQGAFRDMSALYPGLRMARCEHHFIFVLPRDGAPALVVAILHERMDLMVRLQERL